MLEIPISLNKNILFIQLYYIIVLLYFNLNTTTKCLLILIKTPFKDSKFSAYFTKKANV